MNYSATILYFNYLISLALMFALMSFLIHRGSCIWDMSEIICWEDAYASLIAKGGDLGPM